MIKDIHLTFDQNKCVTNQCENVCFFLTNILSQPKFIFSQLPAIPTLYKIEWIRCRQTLYQMRDRRLS